MGFRSPADNSGLPRPAGASGRHGRLGVSLLQASAAQVPIIASRAGGMPEAVRRRKRPAHCPWRRAGAGCGDEPSARRCRTAPAHGRSRPRAGVAGVLDRGNVRGQSGGYHKGAGTMKSLHMIGSKTMGGAERSPSRIAAALPWRARRRVAIRAVLNLPIGSLSGVTQFELPFRTVGDPWSRAQFPV